MEEPIADKAQLLQRSVGLAHAVWLDVVDWVTPPLCLHCQTAITRGAALCAICWQKLTFLDEPVCDALGIPFAFDEGEGALSPAAIADPPHWDKGRAAVAFDDRSKHLVHLLKYRDVQEAGLAMARMMVGAGRGLLAESEVIIPVPLHRLRLWRRRFNQAAFLALQIAGQTKLPCLTDVLLRQRPTTPQVGLDAVQRRRNVRTAFAVSPDHKESIEGKTVLLIDDVRTTGATCNACAAALKNAGAARVHVLSFALVLEPARLHIDA
jgi:ComF family protein